MVGRVYVLLGLLALVAVSAHSHSHKGVHKHSGHDHDSDTHAHPSDDHHEERVHIHTSSDHAEAELVHTGESAASAHFDIAEFINIDPIKEWCSAVGVETSAYVSTAVLSLSAFVVFAVLGLLKKVTSITGAVLATLIAFAAGSLLGDVFLHILPETSFTPESQMLVIAGIFLFYLFDKVLTEPHDHSHSVQKRKGGKKQEVESVFLYLVADAMHNFLDGMAVAVAFRTKVIVGITTSFAILFHEMPHELADFVVLMKSGRSLKKALLLQFLTGVAAMVGTWVALKDFSKENIDRYALPLIVGNFLYLAMTGMMGELKENKSWKSLFGESLGFVCGALLMFKLTLIE